MSHSATKLDLAHGQTAEVTSDDGAQTLQLKAADGSVQLTVRITADGPVLVLSGARIELEAAESIALKTRHFSVDASESVDLGSQGTLDLHSQGELKVTTAEDCRVAGKMIWLN